MILIHGCLDDFLLPLIFFVDLLNQFVEADDIFWRYFQSESSAHSINSFAGSS
jgi:hypothetical protein